MIVSHRAAGIAFFGIIAIILIIQSFRSHNAPAIRHVGSQLSSKASSDVLNTTLGVCTQVSLWSRSSPRYDTDTE